MRLLKLAALVAVTGALLVFAGSASAGGNGAQTFTQVDKNVVEVMPPGPDSAQPCSGALGTLTLTYNDVFHGTSLANGTSWFTGTLTGTLLFIPVDSSNPTYTGHFTQWFGDENNLKNDVEPSTFNVNATGSDGSHLLYHENDQAAMNANGVVTVSFQHAFCG